MNLTFSWKLNTLPGGFEEYEIYCCDEIFCHLSESDFHIFSKMCRVSGNRFLRRV